MGCTDITVTRPITAVIRGCGDRLFADVELYSRGKGRKRHFLEGVEVSATRDGFIEAVYMALHLRTRFLVWHGVYGADYSFLLNADSTWVHGIGTREELNRIKSKVDRPLGIRVCKRRDRFYVSCLKAYSSGKLVDKAIRVDSGKVIELPSPDVIAPGRFCLFQ